MLIKTKAIVLSKLRYRDNDLIIKCLTEEKGVVSYIVRGVGGSKSKGSKLAYFQLLSQLFLEQTYRSNKSLQTIKEMKVDYHYETLHSDIVKGTIVMFLAEILASVLKEEEKNKTLFDYVQTSLQFFDHQDAYSNFHLFFLLNLTKPLGFYPDTSQIEGSYFNLNSGMFQNVQENFNISGHNLTLLKQLLGTNFDAIQEIKLNTNQRQSFLNMLLLYYELHLGSFPKPRSLQVLNQVFN